MLSHSGVSERMKCIGNIELKKRGIFLPDCIFSSFLIAVTGQITELRRGRLRSLAWLLNCIVLDHLIRILIPEL